MIHRVALAAKNLFGKYITYQTGLMIFVAGVIFGEGWSLFVEWLVLSGKQLPFFGGG